MGAGIASMHNIGMAAMRLPAMCRFNSFLVTLSIVFAVRFLSPHYGLPFTSEIRKRGSAGKS
jgi:NO-binding membrane sensor protein with MHYT domain